MVEKVNRKDNRILQVKINDELKLKFDTMCFVLNVNKSNLVRSMLEDWITQQLKDEDTKAKYEAKLTANQNILAVAPEMRSIIHNK